MLSALEDDGQCCLLPSAKVLRVWDIDGSTVWKVESRVTPSMPMAKTIMNALPIAMGQLDWIELDIMSLLKRGF
jgi:hypothetical protein